MDFYSKPYESCGAGQCRFWYHFSIILFNKDRLEKKPFGYWKMHYDGTFHFFNLFPFILRWHKRPITDHEYIESHLA